MHIIHSLLLYAFFRVEYVSISVISQKQKEYLSIRKQYNHCLRSLQFCNCCKRLRLLSEMLHMLIRSDELVKLQYVEILYEY